MNKERVPDRLQFDQSYFQSFKQTHTTHTHRYCRMVDFEPLTSTVKPLSHSVLTIRVIKSFQYRNVKNIVLHDYDISTKTPGDLLKDVLNKINTEGAYRPYRNVQYDALKVYTHAHGSKTVNLVINFEHDEDWFLDTNSDQPLHSFGVDNETEISLFKLTDYQEFKKNPEEKW